MAQAVEGHLNSPILLTECNFLLDNSEFFCARHKKCKFVLNKEGVKRHIYNVCHSPWHCLESWIKNSKRNKGENDFHRIIKAATRSMIVQKVTYLGGDYPGREGEEDKVIKECMANKILLDYYSDKTKAEFIKDKFTQRELARGEFITIDNNLMLEKEICIFNCPHHGKSVLPTTLLIGSLDNLQSRFLAYFYSFIGDIYKKYETPQSGQLDTFTKSICEIRRLIGDDVFTILANCEPLAIGNLIKDENQDLGFQDLYETAMKNILAVFPLFKTTPAYSILCPQDGSQDTKMQRIELLGVIKTFGHPHINPLLGFNAVRELTTEKVPIDLDFCKELQGDFIYLFCKGYYKSKNKWPDPTPHPHAHEYTESAVNSGRRLTTHEEETLTSIDWQCVNLLKNFDFPTHPDLSDYLKDSALAPPLSKWTSVYDHCAFKITHKQNKPRVAPPVRRTIIAYLKADGNLPEKLINEQQNVDACYSNTEEQVIFLCPKEREFKQQGRLYCQQENGKRIKQVLSEHAISEHILPCFEQITMTNSELQLLKRMMSVTGSMVNESTEMINLDLSKWNTRFRHELVWHIAILLDKLFGLNNMYVDIHRFYQRCIILLNNRLLPPKIGYNGLPMQGPSCQHGQEGGFEGMSQKLWTIITVLIIQNVARKLNIKISQLGQGDNQVIVIKWSRHQVAQKGYLRVLFLKRLEEAFKSVNLVMKPEETFYSNMYFEYGKIRYYNGQPIPGALKKICRAIPDINDGIPTINTQISTICTCSESASRADWLPEPGVIVMLFEYLNLLQRRQVTDENTNHHQLVALTMWHSVIGGFPISSYPYHVLRGLDDRLTVIISIIQHLKVMNPQAFESLSQLVSWTPQNPINWKGILQDIFSLNIKQLPSAEHILRDEVERQLHECATNPEVVLLLSSASVSLDNIVDILKDARPFLAPLLHELLRCSNAGILMGLIGRFSKIASITSLASSSRYERGGKSFFMVCKESDNRVYKEVSRRLKSSHIDLLFTKTFEESTCSAAKAFRLRETALGIPILGVTHAVPWEQVKIQPWDNMISEKRLESIWIELSNDLRQNNPRVKEIRGPFSIYMGSITSKKVKRGSLEVLERTQEAKALLTILVISSFARRMNSESLARFCDLLIEEKKHLLSDELTPQEFRDLQPSNYGGHILHRFHSIVESQGALANILATFSSHVTFATGHMGEITKGGDDYTLHFQMIFLYNQSYFSILRGTSRNFPTNHYAATLQCLDCTQKLPNMNIEIPNTDSYVSSDISRWVTSREIKIGCPEEDNISLQKGLSFYLGGQISQYIRSSVLVEYQDPHCVSILRDKSNLGEVNIYNLRASNLFYLLTGMLHYSYEARKLFESSLRGGGLDMEVTTILETLANKLESAGRLNDLMEMAHLPIIYSNQRGVSSMSGDVTLRASIIIYKEYCLSFLWFLTSISHEGQDSQKERSLLFWIGNQLKYILHHVHLNKPDLTKPIKSKLYKFVQEKVSEYQTNFDMKIAIKRVINYIADKAYEATNLKFPRSDLLIYEWRQRGGLNDFKYYYPQKTLRYNTTVCEVKSLPKLAYPPLIQSIDYSREPGVERDGDDCSYHVGRLVGKISSSASKLAVVLGQFSNTNRLPRNGNLITLAEGQGGCALLLCHLIRCVKIYFNTLRIPDEIPHSELSNVIPLSFCDNKCNIAKFVNIDTFLAEGETNIRDPRFINKFISVLERDEEIVMVTIDAQSVDRDSNLSLFNLYIPHIFTSKGRSKIIFITKMFGPDSIPICLSVAAKYNVNCFVSRPLCSRNSSQEFYIIVGEQILPNIHQDISCAIKEGLFNSEMLGSRLTDYQLSEVAFQRDILGKIMPCMNIVNSYREHYHSLFSRETFNIKNLQNILSIVINSTWERHFSGRSRGTSHAIYRHEKGILQKKYMSLFITLYVFMRLKLKRNELMRAIFQLRRHEIELSFRCDDNKYACLTKARLKVVNDDSTMSLWNINPELQKFIIKSLGIEISRNYLGVTSFNIFDSLDVKEKIYIKRIMKIVLPFINRLINKV